MAMPIKSFLRTMSSGCKLKYVERKKIVKLQRSLLNDNNRRQMVVSPKVANCVMRGRLFMAKFIGATSHFSINVSLDIFLFFPKKEYFSLWQYRLWSFKSGDTKYRISSYSFRGNYSFLNLEIQRSQYIRPKITQCAETI